MTEDPGRSVGKWGDGPVHRNRLGETVVDTFDADVVEGFADLTVGCFSEGGNIVVFSGNFTVQAEYLETVTHEGSSDPTPSTLSCTSID